MVSTPYIEHWNDLIDLWYLGMQVTITSDQLVIIVAQVSCKDFAGLGNCPENLAHI